MVLVFAGWGLSGGEHRLLRAECVRDADGARPEICVSDGRRLLEVVAARAGFALGSECVAVGVPTVGAHA